MERNCKNCKNQDCYWVGADDDDICDEYLPKTNADRIRTMTDEELANWYFDKFFPYVPYCSILQDECPEHDDCKICLFEWLKQECAE